MIHPAQEGYYEILHQTMTEPTLSNPQYIVTEENMMLQTALIAKAINPLKG